MTRVLGRSSIEVSDIGFGCWPIGGPATSGGQPMGWGAADDTVSIAAIRRALDLGVTFFDTADIYGAGHSEMVLGRALARHRDEVVIASKFGYTFDEQKRMALGANSSTEYIGLACRESLRRLGTDRIDLYQLHRDDLPLREALEVGAMLEQLVKEGLIRAYGWSTDDPERMAGFAAGPHCSAVQHGANVLHDTPEMFAVSDAFDLASIIRSPLAMGMLTGKYTAQSRLPSDDVRSAELGAPAFVDGRPAPGLLAKIDAIREVLTSGGRSLAQGALAWLLGRSARTIPIPGIRTVEQADENAATLRIGPLTPSEMAEIAGLLGR